MITSFEFPTRTGDGNVTTRVQLAVYNEYPWRVCDVTLKDAGGHTIFTQKNVEVPLDWSDQAARIVVNKYFSGQLDTPAREVSVFQVVHRICSRIVDWGVQERYFTAPEYANKFYERLMRMMLEQSFAFNSPVWFNLGVESRKQQASACFINSVDDSMESILNLGLTEGILFKGGSGTGSNLSKLRAEGEPLSTGGTSTGPLSFMRGLDAMAGAIKSGGATRRAARMMILNADHPDIEKFVSCKVTEDGKAKALIAAGYTSGLNGEAYNSIAYQNANHSVRVTDAFMRAATALNPEDRRWELKFVTNGAVAKVVQADELLHSIAEATWECGDPGLQFDTKIQEWHTTPKGGRIEATNPCCFVGGTLVDTAEGRIPIAELARMHSAGEVLPYAFSFDVANSVPTLRPITNAWLEGEATELVEVTTDKGIKLRCTPEHQFLKRVDIDNMYAQAKELKIGMTLRGLDKWRNPEAGRRALVARRSEYDTVASITRVDASKHPVPVYNITVAGTHNFGVSDDADVDIHSLIVKNSEYIYLNDTACNLGSLNLLKYLDQNNDKFNWPQFVLDIHDAVTAMDIIVGNADYPTEQLRSNSVKYRTLGIGYANLGALLMSLGVPYDSDVGRHLAAAVTSLMSACAYKQSKILARDLGPAVGVDAEGIQEVIEKHLDANLLLLNSTAQLGLCIDGKLNATALAQAREIATEADRFWTWLCTQNIAPRNAQVTVLAPTGTIAFAMDCETTGCEPELALVKFKTLVGGGVMAMPNKLIGKLLINKFGLAIEDVDAALTYVSEHGTLQPYLNLPQSIKDVFKCSFLAKHPDDVALTWQAHVDMLAALQPFLSGGISKTINMPSTATVDDIFDAYVYAWKAGLKCVAIYRDGSKDAQPMRTGTIHDETKSTANSANDSPTPVRRKLPDNRAARNHKFTVGGFEGYITLGLYPGTEKIGEVFINASKEGSTISGLLDSIAVLISIGLQYGVPVDAITQKLRGVKFEPAGMTQNPHFRFVSSLVDYVARYLEFESGIAKSRSTVAEQLEINFPDTKGKDYADNTSCNNCGGIAVRAGSCYTCTNCGESTGCG